MITGKYDKKAGKISFTLDVEEAGKKSKSGKNFVIASTGGNVVIQVDGLGALSVGINAFSKEDLLGEK